MGEEGERVRHAAEYLLRAEALSTDPRVKYQIRQARQLLIEKGTEQRFVKQ